MYLAALDPDSLLRQNPMSPMPRNLRDLRVYAALLVACVWIVSLLYGMLRDSWVALGSITPTVTIVAAAIFAMRNGNGDSGK